jgi:sugar transferase EpsL
MVGAGIALVLALPVLISTAAAVRIFLGSPILFRQVRPGLHGRPFTLYKFRTMTNANGRDGKALSDGARLTRFGRFLRSTSVDELPELWNVLRGEMSLVGPRPLLMEYLPRYSAFQTRRHEVRPGITGWAQVNGRNTLNWQDKLALDVWYVEHASPLLDMKIIVLTAWKILRREGINYPGHATMEEFLG